MRQLSLRACKGRLCLTDARGACPGTPRCEQGQHRQARAKASREVHRRGARSEADVASRRLGGRRGHVTSPVELLHPDGRFACAREREAREGSHSRQEMRCSRDASSAPGRRYAAASRRCRSCVLESNSLLSLHCAEACSERAKQRRGDAWRVESSHARGGAQASPRPEAGAGGAARGPAASWAGPSAAAVISDAETPRAPAPSRCASMGATPWPHRCLSTTTTHRTPHKHAHPCRSATWRPAPPAGPSTACRRSASASAPTAARSRTAWVSRGPRMLAA
jgi:hypothetical protein